jgi:ribosomal-protein-alanine N-acetyltransferase
MRAIEREGLTLEPQAASHAPEMFAVLSDPAIYQFENHPPPSLEWLRERFERLESRRSGDGREQWLNWVVRTPDAKLIGYVQATLRENGEADIAYELGSAWWGRGLASRAVAAMIDELGTHYGVRRVNAVFKSANLRSRRLLERLGFSSATASDAAARYLEPGETLMRREIEPGPGT